MYSDVADKKARDAVHHGIEVGHWVPSALHLIAKEIKRRPTPCATPTYVTYAITSEYSGEPPFIVTQRVVAFDEYGAPLVTNADSGWAPEALPFDYIVWSEGDAYGGIPMSRSIAEDAARRGLTEAELVVELYEKGGQA